MQSSKQNILVFDTTTVACTVALKCVDQIFSRHLEIANIHSQKLLTMIDEVLQEADINLSDLSYLAVGTGPGSFTGLRIGIGVAQALAYCYKLKVVAISSLEMLAVTALSTQQENLKGRITVAHDARMSEVYTATYKINPEKRLSIMGELCLQNPEYLDFSAAENRNTDKDSKQLLCGNAWKIYQERIPKVPNNYVYLEQTLVPNAHIVVEYLAQHLTQCETINWQALSPVYIRNNVAKKTSKKPII